MTKVLRGWRGCRGSRIEGRGSKGHAVASFRQNESVWAEKNSDSEALGAFLRGRGGFVRFLHFLGALVRRWQGVARMAEMSCSANRRRVIGTSADAAQRSGGRGSSALFLPVLVPLVATFYG